VGMLYAFEIYATRDRAIIEVAFTDADRHEQLAAQLRTLGNEATGYRLGEIAGEVLADGYEVVTDDGQIADGRHWSEIPIVLVTMTEPPMLPEPRVRRERSLDPANAELQADIAEMIEGAEAVRAEAQARADVAANILNSLQIMAACSSAAMVKQQRDILWRLLSDCAVNGWQDISEPIADFVIDTRED
jgi:hypothetical protein